MEKTSTTKLVAAQGNKTKMRAIRDLTIGDTIIKPGQEFEATEEQAKELCAPIAGPYAFSGYRSDSDAPVAQIVRAERI